MKHVVYLHGFPSSAVSTKAQMLAERFAIHPDIHFHTPDLNVPDFEHITLTAMIVKTAQTVADLHSGDVVLIGSSMGGLTALHFLGSQRNGEAHKVKAAVLMAPALDVFDSRDGEFSPETLARWRAAGFHEFPDYDHGGTLRVHYGLVDDLRQYDSYAVSVSQPIVIYHGTQDDVVDSQQSVRYALDRPGVTLHLVDSDHRMLDQIDAVYAKVVGLLDA
jgi:pimeloyl-ACP methyl ester carboxylesterase